MASDRRIELWPLLLAVLLLAGIGTSLAFYAIARANPDAEVVREAPRVGLVLEGPGRSGRLVTRLG